SRIESSSISRTRKFVAIVAIGRLTGGKGMKPNSIPSRRGQAGVSDEPPEAMRREDATLARPHAEADDDAVAAPVGQAGDQQAGEPAAAEVERAARGGEATQRHDGEPDRGAFHEFHQVAMTHERYL